MYYKPNALRFSGGLEIVYFEMESEVMQCDMM